MRPALSTMVNDPSVLWMLNVEIITLSLELKQDLELCRKQGCLETVASYGYNIRLAHHLERIYGRWLFLQKAYVRMWVSK